MIAVALVWRMGLYGESILFSSAVAETTGVRPLRDAAIGVAVGVAVVFASEVATRLTGWGDALARELAAAIGPISLPNALLLAMASGLGEELFFRGALQPRVGLVVASLAFGAMHFVPRREMWPWTVFALVVGLLFGALFEWTGSVIAPVVAHSVVNGINLPLLVRRYGTPP
jgi:membrane protease YdiL (CAAX protease family)